MCKISYVVCYYSVATIEVMRFVYLSYGWSDETVSCVRSEVGSLVIWD